MQQRIQGGPLCTHARSAKDSFEKGHVADTHADRPQPGTLHYTLQSHLLGPPRLAPQKHGQFKGVATGVIFAFF